MSNNLVIYHGQCRDGWCAAWVLWRSGFQDAVFLPGMYGAPIPDVKDKDVTLVDFSYPREVMDHMRAEAKSLRVLDHHKTAEAAMKDFPGNHVFDMTRSGAGIAWDEYQPHQRRPWLVDYVEDRDLWLHRLPSSEEINAYIAALEFDFEVWESIYNNVTVDVAEERGRACLEKTKQYVREVCKNSFLTTVAGYHGVPVVNAPQVDISEVLAAMLDMKGHRSPFVLGWFRRSDGMYVYSLRSGPAFDVSEIAKRFGGGGHKQAAGFQLREPLTIERESPL